MTSLPQLIHRCLVCAVVAAGLVLLPPALCTAQQAGGQPTAKIKKAPTTELKRTEHYLKKFEFQVKRMRGQGFRPNWESKEALKRIKALKIKYPDDPAVEALFQRARTALMKSKGGFMEITPAMVAYRENEKKLQKIFADHALKAWQDYQARIAASKKLIKEPWPPASHREVPVEEMIGKYVVLDEFQFPTNEFTDMGRQFVFIGSGVRGFYFIDLNGRNFLGPYEAIKRYRRMINQDVPEGGKWTIVGRISGLELLVPQAGKKKTQRAMWGWKVEPEAIYVPDRTFAVFDPKNKLGAEFAAEARMEAIKSQFYTVKSIPDDVTPQRLLEIYATAIKEKNYKLYLACIDPRRQRTPLGSHRIMYHWEKHQWRFAKFYVHVMVDKAKTEVISGFDSDDSIEGFFLDDAQKQALKKRAGELVEIAFTTSGPTMNAASNMARPSRVFSAEWTASAGT